MRVFYRHSEYISHARAGQANMRALAQAGHELVRDPALADAVVLHDEPVYLDRHLAEIGPALAAGTPLVAYAVVETDPMPPAFVEPLSRVDEVWTCSGFSRDLLAREVDNVHVVPHVVERPRFQPGDAQRVRVLAGEFDGHTFYTVVDSVNPRKNLPALLRAFAALRTPRVRLVVKQYRENLDLSGLPGVVSIAEPLTGAQMAALHASCDCYVSTHRAEAWGLGMSEAMAFGRPVVATGYSGNMEFMDERNSFPVPCRLERIDPGELLRSTDYFTPDMVWASVDEPAFTAAMRRAMREGTVRGRLAAEHMRHFSPACVGRTMDQRLRALVGNTVRRGS